MIPRVGDRECPDDTESLNPHNISNAELRRGTSTAVGKPNLRHTRFHPSTAVLPIRLPWYHGLLKYPLALPLPARLGRQLPERQPHNPNGHAAGTASHARFPASPRANAGMDPPRASHMRESPPVPRNRPGTPAQSQSPSSPLMSMGPCLLLHNLKGKPPGGPPRSRLGQLNPPAALNPTLPVWRIPPEPFPFRGRRRGRTSTFSLAAFFFLLQIPFVDFRQANASKPSSHAYPISPSHLSIVSTLP